MATIDFLSGVYTVFGGETYFLPTPTDGKQHVMYIVNASANALSPATVRGQGLPVNGIQVAFRAVLLWDPTKKVWTFSAAVQVSTLSEGPPGPKGDKGDQGDPGAVGPPPPLSGAIPQPIGAASAGVSANASRDDHVHAHGSQGDPTNHAVATVTDAGFMSALDKSNLDSHLLNTFNPHATTATQVGADPAGTATAAVSAHEGTYTHANLPSTDEKAALPGTNGTPGAGNKYVTDSDPRNTNARAPTAHASSHLSAGSDPIPVATTVAAGLMSATDKVRVDSKQIDRLAFRDAGLTYVETNSAAYVAVAQFIYRGTANEKALTRISALLSSNVIGGLQISARVQDITNALTICEATGIVTTTTLQAADLGIISNLPVGVAIFEVQFFWQTGAGVDRARIHGIHMES